MEEEKRTFSEKHPKLNILLGIILCAVIVVLAICAIKYLCNVVLEGMTQLLAAASNLDAVVMVALITGSISLIGVIISSIVAKIIDYRKSRKEYLTKKREQPYRKFVDMVYQLQKNIKKPGEYSEEQMLEDLSKFSRQMTLWGSPKVVNKWNQFRENGSDPAKAESNLLLLEDIMNDMRKDLGVGKVKKGNLLGFFVNGVKSAMKKYQ